MTKDPRFGQSTTHNVFENDLIKIEKAQKALLCEISDKLGTSSITGTQTGVDCDGNSVIVANSILTTPAPNAVQLVKICGASDTYDAEVVCLSNDGGLTTVTGWEVFNISALGVTTSKLYLNGTDVTGVYSVVPCGVKVKYDYEFEKICVDGNEWTKTYVYDPSSSIPTLVSVLWLDENDLPQPTPSLALINNANCTLNNTASVASNCSTVERNEVLGYNRLRNGDFQESTGVGATSLPNVGWETIYTAVDILDTAPIGSYLLFEGDLGLYTNANYSVLATSKAIALKSLGTGTPPLFQFTTEFEFGKSYRLTGAVAYFLEFGTVGAVQSSDEFNTIIIPQPAIEGFFEQFSGDFVWQAPTGSGTIRFAQTGLNSSDPIILFDNLQVREIVSTVQSEVLTPIDYTSTNKVVIDQIVKTVNCNDERRDNLLVDIADVIVESSTKLEQALNNNAADWELLEVELVDDVAGNGTGAIIPYSELYNVSSTGVRTLIGVVDEKGADYTLLGTRRNREEIGVNSRTATNQTALNNSTWSPTETMSSYSYVVIKVMDINIPPTFTGSNNVTVPLFEGETANYDVIDGTEKFNITNVVITANAGDIIKIIYTEITI